MILLKLFMVFFKIGVFSFGGGYAMIPFIEKEIIQNNQWITSQNFIDIIAISQMTPGPIAINAATFVGYTLQGIGGSSMATMGVTLPSLIFGMIISKYFFKFKNSKIVENALKGIRPTILSLIIVATISVAKTSFSDYKSFIIGLGAFYLLYKHKMHPILIIVLAGFVGLVIY